MRLSGETLRWLACLKAGSVKGNSRRTSLLQPGTFPGQSLGAIGTQDEVASESRQIEESPEVDEGLYAKIMYILVLDLAST